MTTQPHFGRFANVPFFYKLIVSFVLVVTLPVAGLSLYSYVLERHSAAVREKSTLRAISSKMADDIDKYLVTNQNLIRYLALNANLKGLVLKSTGRRNDALTDWLRTQLSVSPEYSAMYVLNTAGVCIASTEFSFIGKDYSVRYYFSEPMKGKVYKSDWTIGLTSGEPGIYISAPIIDGTKVAAVIVLKMRVDRIVELISFWRLQNKDAFLLNSAGVVLTHSRQEYNYHSLTALTPAEKSVVDENQQFAGRKIPSLDLPKLRDQLGQALLGGANRVAQYHFQGGEKMASLSPLKEQNWVVGVSVPEREIYAHSNLILRDTLVFSLLSLIAAIAVGLLMGRLISNPVLRLIEKVNLFGSGHGYVRAEVESRDEIGQLASSFNRMADTIEEHRLYLEDKVRQRTRELENLNEELKNLSVRDPLTGCYNRRYLYERLSDEVARSGRNGLWLTVIMCDLDHFKSINDTHGHTTGDAVLVALSRMFLEMTRERIDWTVRYGGEEFIIVLPETDLEGGVVLAERLRSALAERAILVDAGKEIRATASFGVTAVNFAKAEGEVTPDMLTVAGDTLLYRAKAAGRNCVIAEEWKCAIPAADAAVPHAPDCRSEEQFSAV